MSTNFHPVANMPFPLAMAEQEIYSTYGDRVSIWDKRKTLIKFGRNGDVDTAAQETIWNHGGHETYIFTNGIDSISSDNAGDTQEVTIEGHTITGSGADAQYTFVVQTATLSGQTRVALSTPLARCSRVANRGGTSLAGDVYVYENGAITGGVPDDASTVHARVSVGTNQTRKAATTFSNTDYFICTQITAAVERAQAAVVDVIFEVRQPGGIFLPKVSLTATQSGRTREINPYLLVPKNSDCRLVASTTANNTGVTGTFNGYLAKVL